MAGARATLGTIVKLALASLLVGMLLAAVGFTPADLLASVMQVAGGVIGVLGELVGWAGSYLLLGALVVVPVWLARRLWKRFGRDD